MAASKGPFQVLVRYYSDSTSHNAGVFKTKRMHSRNSTSVWWPTGGGTTS